MLLNKILTILFLPSGFALLCMLAGLVLHKRLFIWLGVLVLLLFSTPFISDALMLAVEGSAGRMPVSSVKNADAIVVLSGMVEQVKGAPLGEWGSAVDRFEGGIELFKAGKAPVIVFTRGQLPWQTKEIPEGELLAERAVMSGVPRSAIDLTGKAGNTAEEALAVKALQGSKNGFDGKRIILVTSAFHMSRAVLLFEEAGFEVVPFRVDYQVIGKSGLTVLRFLPGGKALEQSEKAMRELIGWVYYRWRMIH